ncbi:hypothetical protein A0H81_13168 [Grifola frondosa]|uniref:Uncharacterized protein n=1 Tax=Grifola frondosa TaxID=5627 RepID=A0A1C7LPZ3_GRIFR|nr:hypothetical protein A0H81_13168 [Grifola frondosa]
MEPPYASRHFAMVLDGMCRSKTYHLLKVDFRCHKKYGSHAKKPQTEVVAALAMRMPMKTTVYRKPEAATVCNQLLRKR